MNLRRRLILLLCGVLGPAAASEVAPRLTLLDGAAVLHTGARALQARVGARLPPGTLVDSGALATLLRIEWPDGSLLDIGPATRVMVLPPAPLGSASAFYLLQGWAKFSQPAGGRRGWATPVLACAPTGGTATAVVLWVDGPQTRAFAESGAQALLRREGAVAVALPAGQELSVAPGRRPELAPHVSADLLGHLPRAFRDPLPSRWAVLAPQDPALVALPPPPYADLKPWLVAEPALRRAFPSRWAGRLAEPDFRQAVQANLALHPEWAAALAPPKPRPAGASR